MDSSFILPSRGGRASPPRKTWFFGVPSPAVRDCVVPENSPESEFWTVLQSAVQVAPAEARHALSNDDAPDGPKEYVRIWFSQVAGNTHVPTLPVVVHGAEESAPFLPVHPSMNELQSPPGACDHSSQADRVAASLAIP